MTGLELRTAKEYVLSELKTGVRVGCDSCKGFADKRPRTAQLNFLPHLVGSAIVSLGTTVTVVAGITPEFGPCDPARPNEGRWNVEVSFPPICKGSNPTPIQSAAIERQRKTFTSHLNALLGCCTSTKDLCIIPKEACWVVHVDVVVLQEDGGALDAAVAATFLALSETVLPVAMLPDGITQTEAKKIPIRHFPVSMSFAIIDSVLVADPSGLELELASNSAWIAVSREDGRLLRVIHEGGEPIEDDRLTEMVTLATIASRQ
jgi:exosome complex component RRP42